MNDKSLNINDIYTLAATNNTLTNIHIELLSKCNWKCKHCYLPEHTNEGFTKEILFDLFKQFREMGVFEITFTGGEIFCKKDIMEIIKKAREMHFEVNLLTNASLLDENMIDELAKLYISSVSCTIFSLNEEIHDSITGVKGSLKKALNNVFLLKKYNIPLLIKTILTKLNYSDYNSLISFCRSNNFAYKVDPGIFPKNNGDLVPLDLRLSTKDLENILLDVDSINGYSPDPSQRTSNSYMCPQLRRSLAISCTGDVFPCNVLFYSVGNIYTQKLTDIWNNSIDLNHIKSLKWSDLKVCNNCNKKIHCVRCAGIALLEDGDMLGKSSFACNLATIRCNSGACI